MAIAFACALCACVKQRLDFEREQNALASALNNAARQKGNVNGVAPLTADELIAKKNEEIASLNKLIAKYDDTIERESRIQQDMILLYNDVGLALNHLIVFTGDCKKNLFHAIEPDLECSGSEVRSIMEDTIDSISRAETNVVERLPNYYPQIGEKIDCACMEEVGEKKFGNVTQIVEPGKKCGTFVVRKAKVKTERRIQE